MIRVMELGDCALIIAGQSPKSEFYNTAGDGLPFFQGKADFGDVYPKIRVYCTAPIKIAEKDDILLSVRAPVGPTNLAPATVCIGRGLSAIRPNEQIISRKYLLLYFKHFELQLAAKGTGTTFNSINQKIIKALVIPVPPLDEQARIVARIEELFSELDNGVQTLQTIKRQLAVYRQAVLKEAFELLTDETAMGNVADMIDPQPSHRTPPEVENGVPYIGIGDIDYTHSQINFETARKVSPSVLNEHIERYTLHDGDFVMGKIGTIGKPFRLPRKQNYTLSANVILIQPKSESILPGFLFWQFASPFITAQLKEGEKATSQPAFGIKKARVLVIKTASLSEQEKIVEEIESRLSVCDSIEKTVDTALAQAEAMRQSILKKAFEGGLV